MRRGRPGRSLVTRSLVTVLSLAIAGTVAAGLLATAAGAGPGPTESPSGFPSGGSVATPLASTVVVLIDDLTPVAPKPTDTLHLAGRLLNTGEASVTNIFLRLRFGPVLSRFDLHRLRATPETPTGFGGTPKGGPPALAAHGTSAFAFDVPLTKLPYLSADGVHALRIEVHGSLGSATDVEVGDGDTFLPVFAKPPVAPTRIAWVIPFAAAPSLAADGALRDPTITTDLAAHGRLSRVLAAAAPAGPGDRAGTAGSRAHTPVTFALDPLTVQLANQVSRAPYQVHGTKGLTTLPADPAAARWLTKLNAEVRRSDVLTLPYADVDLVSLVANGRSGEVVNAFAKGRNSLASILNIASITTEAWPADGVLSQPAADFLVNHGVTSVLLSDASLPATRDLSFTPTAISDIPAGGKMLTSYVADSAVSTLVNAGSAAAGTPRMAEQLFLAETAMITSQRPSSGQDIVVLPSRGWDPGESYGRTVIADSSHVPWLTAVSLHAMAADPRDVGARQPLAYPPVRSTDASGAAGGSLPDPLPADLLASVAGTRASLRDLTSALTIPTTPAARVVAAQLTASVEATLFGAESAAWRADPTSGYLLAQDAETSTQLLRSKVRAVAARVLTLTSASSPIPVTVVNDLPVEVRVTLFIAATNRAKLASTYRQPVTLPAGAKLRVNIPVRVESAGTFTVLVSVLTPAGQPLGTPQQFVIRSAAYGRIALILTLGALGLLVLAILLRAVRRLRKTSE